MRFVAIFDDSTEMAEVRSSEVTDIPMSVRPRGGRTVIVRPDGSRGVVRRETSSGV